MKTYIAWNRNNHLLCCMANNKEEASEKMKVAKYRVKVAANQIKINVMEELLKAYYACLELANENAFKCTIDIETFKATDGYFYFVVWVKAFSGIFDPDCFVPFYMFSIEKFESNIEKVKQLIQEASC